MADTENKVDSTIGGLANLYNAPDDALLVVEYLGKSYNSTMAQLKAALGTITGFGKTAGDGTPGSTDVYTINFGNGKKLDITIPIPTNGKNGYTPQKGVDYNDGYTPQKGKDYNDGYTPQKGVDYHDGFSPTVDVKQLQDGVEITITDATGPHTATLKNPKDGVSPSFRVEVIEGGYRVILSAANEYQQFDLLNGESGDWNVNNPTWKGFIKGRTHWKEEYGVDGEIIPEASAAFSGTVNFTTVAGAIPEGITAKGKYVVTWNGTEYSCEGKEYWDGPYVGNGSIMDSSQEDTGEPFAILMFGDNLYQVWKADKTKETVTVKVVGEKVVIWHKLDGGYLPEGYPYSDGVKLTELYSALVETDPDSGVYEGAADLPLTEGETYVVKYNGVDYVCTCSTMTQGDEYNGMVTFYILGNLGAMTGGDDTGEPFVVMTIPSMGAFGLYALDGSTSVTLSISGEAETIHPMAGKLLPKGTPYMQPFDDVILENTVLADVMVETSLGEGYNLPIGNIVPGNIYNVEFDGVVYRTKAYSVSENELSVIALGSGCIRGGSTLCPGVPFTGDPFIIRIYPAIVQQQLGINAIIAWDYDFGPVDGGTEAIAIRGGYKVNKIDNHCLPDLAIPLIVTFYPVANSNAQTVDISFEEAYCAAQMGRPVFARVDVTPSVHNDGTAFVTNMGFNTDVIWFTGYDGENNLATWTWSKSSITKTLKTT